MTVFNIIVSLCAFGSGDYTVKKRNSCLADYIRCADKNRIEWSRSFGDQYRSNDVISAFYQRCVVLSSRRNDPYEPPY